MLRIPRWVTQGRSTQRRSIGRHRDLRSCLGPQPGSGAAYAQLGSRKLSEQLELRADQPRHSGRGQHDELGLAGEEARKLRSLLTVECRRRQDPKSLAYQLRLLQRSGRGGCGSRNPGLHGSAPDRGQETARIRHGQSRNCAETETGGSKCESSERLETDFNN